MSSALVAYVGVALAVVACVLSSFRWLRVAQREHYLPGTVSTFGLRWWRSRVPNIVLALAGAGGVVASLWVPPTAFLGVLAASAGPLGLSLRGRTAKLATTARLKRVAAFFAVAVAVVIIVGGVAYGPLGAFTAGALGAILAPVLTDLALFVARPLERRLLAPFVEQATRRLKSVSPRVVAITGSYGKTTTKGYVAHLVTGRLSAVATPASFNNTAGLARAINEHLSTGVQVFVAEMGTYGRGEIASMCSWVVPEIAVITAIGPVHLERMKSLENIAEAKSEILDRAGVAVLNIDYPLLDALADKAQAQGKRVWRCSSVPDAPRRRANVNAYWEGAPGPQRKIRVRASSPIAGALSYAPHGGRTEDDIAESELVDVLVAAAPEVEPGNVACAVAVALSLGVPAQVLERQLGSLPGAPHRRAPQTGASGAVVIDDTYNSNPAGARAALALLASVGAPTRRKVVVTPGMVELGHLQSEENRRFAEEAAAVATELIVVGRTNARALLAGARAAKLEAWRVACRQDAVTWVSAHLGPGDAVLFENDLPDHYP